METSGSLAEKRSWGIRAADPRIEQGFLRKADEATWRWRDSAVDEASAGLRGGGGRKSSRRSSESFQVVPQKEDQLC